jgi:outer membrane receptor protein involved in Fe transport
LRLLLILLFILPAAAFSQTGNITGTISDNGIPVPFTTVHVEGTKIITQTDSLGRFQLNNVPYGKNNLVISSPEYNKQSFPFELKSPTLVLPEITVKSNNLEEVVFVKTKTELVKEQPFAVESIDMKPLQSRNLNVNQVLNQTTGVRIRETGGLGSDFVFSLSGFTGNQVRFFVDGLPTEVLGSAYSINSVPVNNVERIEVYKGVVPVHLGSDVLGGAVNIVTNTAAKNFLDVSYGYGSFNTHQTSVVGRYAFKKGILLNASAFYNYSDNNFKIDTYLYDKQTGKKDEYTTSVERFNDAFKSATGNVEIGVVNKRFADRLMIGLIGSAQYKEIQNGANMTEVFGQAFTKNHGFIPTLKYEKNHFFIDNLSLRVSALYSNIQSVNVDTSSREYDWTGAYTSKFTYQNSGEISWYKTLFTFTDQNTLALATLNYKFGGNQQLTLNNTFSRMERVGTDPIAVAPIAFDDPNILMKNFLGLSYQIKLLDNKLTANAFGKFFSLNSLLYKEVYIEETDENVIRKTTNIQQLPGYGAAVSYFVLNNLQVKTSYENTYRLPEGYELFGNGLLLQPNPDLVAEKSQNINAGFLFGKRVNNHVFNFEYNYLYRLPTNLIRSVAIGVLSQYQNLGNGKIHCFEGAASYKYKKALSVEVNATYQSIRNTSLKANGQPDELYGDRLPNMPYLFGNASITYNTKAFGKHNAYFGINWNMTVIEQFFLKWESQGSADSKFIIPRQFVNNASVTYTSHNGRYNVSLSAMNLLDAMCYDNFRVQKPGRSFNIKLRYYLTKQ